MDKSTKGKATKGKCEDVLNKVYDKKTKVCMRCENPDDEKDMCQVAGDFKPDTAFKGKCNQCVALAEKNNFFNRKDVKESCPGKPGAQIKKYCPSPHMDNSKGKCSQNWLLGIFDEDDCIKVPPSTDKSGDVTATEVVIWVILSLLSVICGYLIYNAGGNIPIYLAINLGAVLIYVILRFEI